MGKSGRGTKIVDRRTQVRCVQGKGEIREEIWQGENSEIQHYNLTFIHHLLWPHDNGRVLGYDNAHGDHHRHYCGQVKSFEFTNFTDLFSRFLAEVQNLRKKERL